MFFRKKKKDKGPIPIGEVEQLISSGMGDKDIIKNLKNKGYSYDSIERAMLQAVKQGVGEEKPAPKLAGKPVAEPPAREGFSTLEEVYGSSPEEAAPVAKLPEELMPTQQMPPPGPAKPTEENIPEEFAEDLPKPEIIVEELVEGVVEEKWQKFKKRLDRLEDDFESMKIDEKQLGERIEATGRENPQSREFDSKVSDMSTQLEDLEVRIGGLEKAFRQFLPSLTTNIEHLSDIIHQMKRKQGLEDEL